MELEEFKNELKKGEAFLFVSDGSRRYLTDFDYTDGYLLITPEAALLYADGRYIEAATAQAKNCDEIVLLERASEQLPEAVEKYGIVTVYTEAEKLTVSALKSIRKMLPCQVIPEKADEKINTLRRMKSGWEKERVIKAQRIAEGAFENILKFIRPGVTEIDIRLELEFWMLKHGADDISFETIAVSGCNTSKPHGVPSGKKIENGDFVTMDYGALVKGYHSDMTRTVAVGSVSDKQAEVYNTVLRAQLAAIDTVKAGVPCRDADAAARKVINDSGYGRYFTHSTGHGVGIDIHEAPAVSSRSTASLLPGDIVTAEPGIYIPGEFGVRIEDMVYVTETGCEDLTKAEKSLIIL